MFLESSLQCYTESKAGKSCVYLKGSFIKSTQSPWHHKNVARHVALSEGKVLKTHPLPSLGPAPRSHTPLLTFAICLPGMKMTPGVEKSVNFSSPDSPPKTASTGLLAHEGCILESNKSRPLPLETSDSTYYVYDYVSLFFSPFSPQ